MSGRVPTFRPLFFEKLEASDGRGRDDAEGVITRRLWALGAINRDGRLEP
jgi:hypothetical protein